MITPNRNRSRNQVSYSGALHLYSRRIRNIGSEVSNNTQLYRHICSISTYYYQYESNVRRSNYESQVILYVRPTLFVCLFSVIFLFFFTVLCIWTKMRLKRFIIFIFTITFVCFRRPHFDSSYLSILEFTHRTCTSIKINLCKVDTLQDLLSKVMIISLVVWNYNYCNNNNHMLIQYFLDN